MKLFALRCIRIFEGTSQLAKFLGTIWVPFTRKWACIWEPTGLSIWVIWVMMWGPVNPCGIYYAFAPGLPNGPHSAKSGRQYALAFIFQVGHKWSKWLYLGYVGYICVVSIWSICSSDRHSCVTYGIHMCQYGQHAAQIGTAVLHMGSTCVNMVNMQPR